jgi:hypothetical protein
MTDAILIQKPEFDFDTFLGLTHKMLGYSLSKAADASHRDLGDVESFLSYLAAMQDEGAPVGLTPNLLPHVSYSVLAVAAEDHMLRILQCAAGMPVVLASTIRPPILAAVITGTLAQWRDAVTSGSTPVVAPEVRYCFNKIHREFAHIGLNAWEDCNVRVNEADNTFYLEHKK